MGTGSHGVPLGCRPCIGLAVSETYGRAGHINKSTRSSVTLLGIISITQYHDIIADSSTLRHRRTQRSDNIVLCMNACLRRALLASTDQIHGNSYTNAHRPTCHLFDKQCRTAIIISRTVILTKRQPVSDRAPPGHPTQRKQH